MVSLLFSLENLQVVVNGTWGEDWGYWGKGKNADDCFYIPVCAWLNVRSSLEKELYKYYTEISSLQSTLPSPVQFKIGPDVFMFMSNVKRTWSFLGWKTLNSYAAFVWAHSLQSKEGFCWVRKKNSQMLHKGHTFCQCCPEYQFLGFEASLGSIGIHLKLRHQINYAYKKYKPII